MLPAVSGVFRTTILNDDQMEKGMPSDSLSLAHHSLPEVFSLPPLPLLSFL